MDMGTKKRISDSTLIKDVHVYLAECEEKKEIPQVIRFARRHGYTKQALYLRMEKNPELLDSIKEILDEKELVLEEGGLTGLFNPTMTIFSLKQLGWKDKHEEVISTEEDSTGLIMIAPIREHE